MVPKSKLFILIALFLFQSVLAREESEEETESSTEKLNDTDVLPQDL